MMVFKAKAKTFPKYPHSSSMSLINEPRRISSLCDFSQAPSLKKVKLSIVVTTSLREADFNFITSQEHENISLEWIVFNTVTRIIPTWLRTIQKRVIEVGDINNDLEIISMALRKSTGDFIFFLPNSATILQSSNEKSTKLFDYKLRVLNCNTDVAVMGGLTIYPIDIVTQKPTGKTDVYRNDESNVSFNIYSMSYRLSNRGNNIPEPFHYKNGRDFFSLPKTFQTNNYSFCTSLAGSFLKISAFNNIRFENFGERELNEVHLCIELFKNHKKVIFNHNATIDDFSTMVPYISKIDKRKKKKRKSESNFYSGPNGNNFLKKNYHSMSELVALDRNLNQSTLSVVWEFGSKSCNRWFTEGMEFVTNLDIDSRVPNLRIISNKLAEEYCDNLEQFKFESLDRLNSKIYISPKIDVFISHNPPDEFPTRFPYKGVENLEGVPGYRIGRCLDSDNFEPRLWVENIKFVDELWLPNSFMLKQLELLGIDSSKMFVLPEPVDTELFSPYYSNYLNEKQLAKIVKQLYYRPRNYHFLSILSNEDRNGPEILLQAYFLEFSNVKEVSLHIYTNRDESDPNGKLAIMGIEAFKKKFLKKHPELSKDDLPFVNVITKRIPISILPHFYQIMDCFVLPNGRKGNFPFIEAMAMGLPTIATKYGGNLDLMNNDILYLIDAKMKNNNPEFVTPKIKHFKQLMRHVFTNRKEAKSVGRKARLLVESNYAHDAINNKLVEYLSRIQNSRVAPPTRTKHQARI